MMFVLLILVELLTSFHNVCMLLTMYVHVKKYIQQCNDIPVH